MKAAEQYDQLEDKVSITPEDATEVDLNLQVIFGGEAQKRFISQKNKQIAEANGQLEPNEDIFLKENTDLMRYMARIICQSKPEIKKTPLKMHCLATAQYISDVLMLTPQQYEAVFSTEFNKVSGLANAIRRIVRETPESVKKA